MSNAANSADPYGNFKFKIADGAIVARAEQGRPLAPSAVERLAGLEDDEIRERNRKMDVSNTDLEQWRRTVESDDGPKLEGELTITEPDGRVTFKGRATLLDIKPNYDDLPPGIEMIEVDLG